MAELTHFGMKSVSGDDAPFTMIRNGELFSMTILHVDDFLVAGSSEFLQMLSQKLKRRFTFGKTELAKGESYIVLFQITQFDCFLFAMDIRNMSMTPETCQAYHTVVWDVLVRHTVCEL